MTDGMIMVQWADLTGRGFSPHEVGPEVPREYWAAAERLLQGDLSQPPEGIRSTVGHPVWTLRRVQVQGRWQWCFVVQGRRGPFGVAGTCRFAFAAESMSAWDAWTAGTEVAAADHTLPASPHDPDQFTRAMIQVLGGVAIRQAAVPVAGDPVQAAAIIVAALKVLPERQLRAWSWSTCVLQRPDSPESRVVSGRWPDEFRRSEPNRAESIDQWFRRGPVTEEEIKSRLARKDVLRGFEDLVHYACTGKRPSPELLHGEHTLDEMLVELGHANHLPEWQDVPSMLDSPGGIRRLADNHLPLVEEWARREPGAAIGRLRDDLGAPLTEALLGGAVSAQSGTCENVLGLPTAAAPARTEWHDHLVTLLRRRHPEPKALREVTAGWITPTAVLGNDRDLVAARAWLLRLGLTPADDPAYFPPDPALVITQLNTHHAYTQPAHDEIALTRRPLALLDSLVDQLDPLPGQAVGDLLWMSATRIPGRPADSETRLLQPLATALTRSGLGGKADEHWVDTMLDTVQRHLAGRRSTRLSRIMSGALEALLEVDPDAPRSPTLTQRCLAISSHHHASPAAATALRFATVRSAPHQSRSWPQDGQDTGSYPIVRVRKARILLSSWRRLRDNRKRRHAQPRTRLFFTAAGLATGALVAVTLVIITRTDRATPPAQEQRPPAAAATAASTGPIAPRAEDLQIVLPPRDGRQVLQEDEKEFRAQLERRMETIVGFPKQIDLIGYGGDQARVKELERRLQEDPALRGVLVQSQTLPQDPPVGIAPRSLIGTVVFTK
jgi:hypothetical protein